MPYGDTNLYFLMRTTHIFTENYLVDKNVNMPNSKRVVF